MAVDIDEIRKLGGSARMKGRSRSLLWPRVYDALRRKGMGKSKAAAISNAHWNKYRRWGRAGMPGPRSMAERKLQRRVRKMALGDVHANGPLGMLANWQDPFTDEEIDEIATECLTMWQAVIGDEEDDEEETVAKHGGSSHDQKSHGRRGDGREAPAPPPLPDGPSAGEIGAVGSGDDSEALPIDPHGNIPSGVLRALGKGNRKLWEAGGELPVMAFESFDEMDNVEKTWGGAHFAGKRIALNAKAIGDDPEAAHYIVNHELAHSVDSGGRSIKTGGYKSNTKYKATIDRWEQALWDAELHYVSGPPANRAMKRTYSTPEELELFRQWSYATSYGKTPLQMRAELFAEAVSYAVTPHKRKVLADTDAYLKSRGVEGVSIESDVRQILSDLGLEEEMRKSRDTSRYGRTMEDMGGDGHLSGDEDDTEEYVRKLRLRARLGAPVSILKREVGKKPAGGGHLQAYDEFGRYTTGGRISTAPEKGKVKGKDRPHSMKNLRRLGVDQALQDDPDIGERWLEKISQVAGFDDLHPGREEIGKDIRKDLDIAIERMKANILDIHDRADPKDAKQWGEWYPIANKLGKKWAKENGIHEDAVYAITARLSPQADWNDNITMAREAVRILKEDPVIDKGILKAHRALQLKQAEMYKKPVEDALPKDIEGKRISELDELTAGKVVRAVADARGPLQVITHEEELIFKDDGEPRYVRWQSNDNLMRVVSIYRNPTFENVSKMMGEQHKIRAFYNNIRDPHDTEFDDVTVDTHAFGIALGIPVTTNSTEISNKKGSITIPGSPNSTKAGTVGLYPLFAEAYRRAGKERGMLGRQMQSITWEQWRKEWSPKARNEWMVDTARNVQRAVARGEIDRSESWEILEEFRRQLPGAEGGGTNREDKITGRAAAYTPSKYDGKVDKSRALEVITLKHRPHKTGTPQSVHAGGGGAGDVSDDAYAQQLDTAKRIFEQEYDEHTKRYATDITEVDGTGNWKPERRKLHKKILDEVMAEAAGVPKERKAIFTGGLMGAGKTTQLKQRAAELGIKLKDGNISNFILVSADDMKERLHKHGAIPKVPGLSPGEASVFTHEETSYLSKRLADLATSKGYNLIWDYSMGSTKANEQRADPLVEAGYKIKALFIDVSPEQSRTGADKRHRSGWERWRRGESSFAERYVPTWAMAKREGRWRSGNRSAFEDWKQRDYVSGYMVVDNEGFRGTLIEDNWKEW